MTMKTASSRTSTTPLSNLTPFVEDEDGHRLAAADGADVVRMPIPPGGLVIDNDHALIGSGAFREIAAAALAEHHSRNRPTID